MPQSNFQYGNTNFGHMGSSKEAAQKSSIMNYEQLLSSVFSCFHGLKNDLKILMNSKSLPVGLNKSAKVLIVNSEQDYILASQTKAKSTRS